MDVEAGAGLRFWQRQREDGRVALERQFEEILAEFGPGLARLAASYEGDVQSREDLAQDIRLALWMALPRFRGESSLRTFVYRIAHNRALTHAWKRNRSVRHEGVLDAEMADERQGPQELAIQGSERDRFMAAIRSLPMPMMQVLTLALEDLPQREIATILGTTENNVAVRLNRARSLLRQKLGEHE